MPVFFQHHINESTRLAVWKIEEDETFFHVPLKRIITHPHKRLQHLAGRYLLRYLFPEFPLALVKIADTRKPYLEDEAFHFSISHCGDYAAALVSKNQRVGVDIEMASPKVEKIKEKFLSSTEIQFLEAHMSNSNADQLHNPFIHLTLLWSCKEAVYKWWSYGQVDFSDMIRLQPFSMNQHGKVNASFTNESGSWPLSIQYQIFPDLTLAWVVN